jgi:hypothetical protein
MPATMKRIANGKPMSEHVVASVARLRWRVEEAASLLVREGRGACVRVNLSRKRHVPGVAAPWGNASRKASDL